MKKDREEFEVGERVWCCDHDGTVFEGELTKAGPTSFKFSYPGGRYLRGQLFKKEIDARRASFEPLERQLIRIAHELGRVQHRIDELSSEAGG